MSCYTDSVVQSAYVAVGLCCKLTYFRSTRRLIDFVPLFCSDLQYLPNPDLKEMESQLMLNLLLQSTVQGLAVVMTHYHQLSRSEGVNLRLDCL